MNLVNEVIKKGYLKKNSKKYITKNLKETYFF